MKSNNKHSRRKILKTGITAVASLTTVSGFPSILRANNNIKIEKI